MRTLKTPEEIKTEVFKNRDSGLNFADQCIIAAQRDALECINDKLNLLVEKADSDENINPDDCEAYTLGLNTLELHILNLLPKE